MLKVGLTGGIGSGKTLVANIFRQLGVPVYDADYEARMLTENNPEIKNKIRSVFGKEFFNGDSLDRKQLAFFVFSDEKTLTELNEIIHPFVREHFNLWLKQQGRKKYIIKEAAILFESGSNNELDKIITVDAPVELRISRVMEREKSSREKILNVMKNQWSDEERKAKADFVIINDNQHLIISQVLELHKTFSE